jgi:hypothetical protein
MLAPRDPEKEVAHAGDIPENPDDRSANALRRFEDFRGLLKTEVLNVAAARLF